MGVFREHQHKVTFAHNDVCAGAIQIARHVLFFIVSDAFGNLRKRLASNQFRTYDAELNIGKALVRFIAFFVHQARVVLADDHLYPVFQEIGAVFHIGFYVCDVIQCRVDGRRETLVQAHIFDMVKNHTC